MYAHDGGLWANSEEVWKTAMDVNVLATWHLTEFTEADMKEHGEGSIISVESCGGFTPIPPAVAYGVSKAALAFLIRSLAKTQKRFGAADEAVGAAIFLAASASSYSTGSLVFTEGGRVGTIS